MIHFKNPDARVADKIASEDIIKRNQSVDQYGEVGDTRKIIEAAICLRAGITPKQAKQLASEETAFTEDDFKVAHLRAVDLEEQGRTIADARLLGSEKDIMRRYYANLGGWDKPTAFSA